MYNGTQTNFTSSKLTTGYIIITLEVVLASMSIQVNRVKGLLYKICKAQNSLAANRQKAPAIFVHHQRVNHIILGNSHTRSRDSENISNLQIRTLSSKILVILLQARWVFQWARRLTPVAAETASGMLERRRGGGQSVIYYHRGGNRPKLFCPHQIWEISDPHWK